MAKARQGKGVGSRLLRQVLGLALRMEGEVGCVGVPVDAQPEAAADYARLGFEPKRWRRGTMQTLFLPIETIKRALML